MRGVFFSRDEIHLQDDDDPIETLGDQQHIGFFDEFGLEQRLDRVQLNEDLLEPELVRWQRMGHTKVKSARISAADKAWDTERMTEYAILPGTNLDG